MILMAKVCFDICKQIVREETWQALIADLLFFAKVEVVAVVVTNKPNCLFYFCKKLIYIIGNSPT